MVLHGPIPKISNFELYDKTKTMACDKYQSVILRFSICAIFIVNFVNFGHSAAPNITIIGAGIGGASCAYYLRQWVPQANITILEANDRIGRYNNDTKSEKKNPWGEQSRIQLQNLRWPVVGRLVQNILQFIGEILKKQQQTNKQTNKKQNKTKTNKHFLPPCTATLIIFF